MTLRPMSDPISSRLNFALESSSRAAELILRYYHLGDVTVELKADKTPVTAADQGAEQLLRAEILKAFPHDGVLGEEFGETPGTSGYRWILDPVDGTKSFIAGVPLFGTLVGVEFKGEPVIGLSRFPALGEVVYGSKGQGAWRQVGDAKPQQARVRNTARLEDGIFTFTSVGGWDAAGKSEAFERLCRTARLTRGWGDCYGHCLVATGRADVHVDPVMSLWDCGALLPILTEAGGLFLSWDGVETTTGGNGISTTPALKDQVLDLLHGRTTPTTRGRD